VAGRALAIKKAGEGRKGRKSDHRFPGKGLHPPPQRKGKSSNDNTPFKGKGGPCFEVKREKGGGHTIFTFWEKVCQVGDSQVKWSERGDILRLGVAFIPSRD